eukprot:2052404-Rhodomonas_salina.1
MLSSGVLEAIKPFLGQPALVMLRPDWARCRQDRGVPGVIIPKRLCDGMSSPDAEHTACRWAEKTQRSMRSAATMMVPVGTFGCLSRWR